jgi:hypothetical protein
LANQLANSEEGYFESFKKSVIEMRAPWERIREKVEAINTGDLCKRVSNFEADTDSIFHWGSQCFLQ